MPRHARPREIPSDVPGGGTSIIDRVIARVLVGGDANRRVKYKEMLDDDNNPHPNGGSTD